MKVVLFRHATRSAHGLGDSSLSPTGFAQAQDLPEYVSPKGPIPQPTRVITSPKKRARQTFEPLAQTLHLTAEVDARLDERHQNETAKEFEARVREILNEVATSGSPGALDACVYLCSHLDWLELATAVIPSDMSELEQSMGWSAAEFKVFKISDGVWTYKGGGHIPTRR